MEHTVFYVIPVIIICIVIYIFVNKLVTVSSVMDVFSDNTAQEGFASNSSSGTSPNKGMAMSDYDKLYPESLTPLENHHDAINRLLFGDDIDSSDSNNPHQINDSDAPIIRRDGKFIRRRQHNTNIESFKEGIKIPGLDDITKGFRKIKEGFEAIPKKFTELGNSIKNGFSGILNKIQDAFKQITDTIKKTFTDLWNQIKKAFIELGNKMEKFFKEIGRYIKEFGISLLKYTTDLGLYLGKVFTNIGRGFLYLPDIFMWLFSYIKCGIKFIVNFPKCYRWYALEVFGLVLYTPVAFFFWFFERTDDEKTLWEHIEDVDCKFHSYTGFHLIHYSKSIVDRCYSCCTDDFPQLPRMDWKYTVKWRPVR